MSLSWYTSRRLQTQLLLWTALIVIVSVVGTMEIRVRSNVRLLQDNLRDRSETTLRSLKQVVELVAGSDPGSLNIAALEPELSERVAADRTLIELDVIRRLGSGVAFAASSSEMPDALVRSFSTTPVTEFQQIGGRRVMVTSQAVAGSDYGLVAVASLETIDGYASFNRRGIPAFAAILSLVVITLMHFMYRAIVSKRLAELLEGIQRAKSGEGSRIPDARRDEIGLIAKTLNGLIAQVQLFNAELQNQVARATDGLNRRNLALEKTTRQMLEMQKQLLESERLATVGQLAATFAHEIGSPMTSLSAHVQLLLEDSRITDDQREVLEILLQQIQAMVQIVNEMLKSARRGPEDFVLTDINEILRNVLRLVGPKLTSQRITVAIELDRLPPIRGYPLYLQEAFLNIVNNASDAMPDGGQLDVKSWFDRSEFVNIRISDSGPGIDERVLRNIFDHFVTTKAIGRGTGLGLGIVKEIVDSHCGTFQIESMKSKGTAALIRFPVEAKAELAS